MFSVKGFCKKVVAVGAAVVPVVLADSAYAALAWEGITINTADIESYMGIAVVGLAALWGFRKVIKLMNRS